MLGVFFLGASARRAWDTWFPDFISAQTCDRIYYPRLPRRGRLEKTVPNSGLRMRRAEADVRSRLFRHILVCCGRGDGAILAGLCGALCVAQAQARGRWTAVLPVNSFIVSCFTSMFMKDEMMFGCLIPTLSPQHTVAGDVRSVRVNHPQYTYCPSNDVNSVSPSQYNDNSISPSQYNVKPFAP